MKELNISAIVELIRWAEESQKPIEERDVRYVAWGSWDQRYWGYEAIAEPDQEEAARILYQEPNLCGTAFCMAGRQVANEGYVLLYSDVDNLDTPLGYVENVWIKQADACAKGIPTGKFHRDGTPILVQDPNATVHDIQELAAEMLGLDEGEATRFFGGSNSVDDLKRIANDLCARRRLPEPYEYDDGTFVLAVE